MDRFASRAGLEGFLFWVFFWLAALRAGFYCRLLLWWGFWKKN